MDITVTKKIESFMSFKIMYRRSRYILGEWPAKELRSFKSLLSNSIQIVLWVAQVLCYKLKLQLKCYLSGVTSSNVLTVTF